MIRWFDGADGVVSPPGGMADSRLPPRPPRPSQALVVPQSLDVEQQRYAEGKQLGDSMAGPRSESFERPMPDSNDATRTRLLRPLYALAFLMVLFYAVFNAGQKNFVKASVWGALSIISFAPLAYYQWRNVFPRNVAFATLCCAGLLCGVVYDILSYGMMDSWVYLLVLANALVAADAPRALVFTTVLLVLAYLVLRSLEDVKRFGLYDLIPNENTYAKPLPLGWSTGLTVLLSRLLLALLSFAVVWRYSLFVAVERYKLLLTVHFMQNFASALGHLDLDAAEGAIDSLPSPAAANAFRQLNSRVRLYAQYLPEGFLADDGVSDTSEHECSDNEEINGSAGGAMEPPSMPGAATLPCGKPGDVARLKITPPPDPEPTEDILPEISFMSLGQSAFSQMRKSLASSPGSKRSSRRITTGADPLNTDPGNPLQASRSEHRVSRTTIGTLQTDDELRFEQRLSASSLWKGSESVAEIGVRQSRVTVMSCEVDVTHLKSVATCFDLCTSFISTVMDVVRAEKGVVLEIKADRCLGAWNGHLRCVRHCRHACRAALRASVWWRSNAQSFKWCGAAVATGEAAVGNIGGERRRAAFVHGLPSAQERSLLSLGRTIRTRIIVTEAVVEQTQALMVFRPVDLVPVFIDGFHDPAAQDSAGRTQDRLANTDTVYELCGDRTDSPCHSQEEYSRAFGLFRSGKTAEAASAFAQLCTQHPEDLQVVRLSRLLKREKERTEAHQAKADKLDVSAYVPYCRRLVGWHSATEGQAGPEVPLPLDCSDSTNGLSRDEPHPQRLQGVGRSSDCNSEGRLREDLEEQDRVRTQPCSEAGSSAVGSVMEPGVGSKPPNEFTDRTGSLWRRSAQVVARGGRSELYQVLGEEGVVCMAKYVDVSDDRDATQQGRIDELLREVGHLSTIQHENVVSYISSAVVPGYILTVMEYVSCGSLLSLMNSFGALPRTSCRRYVRHILKGLAFLHTRGIVHRDLKPANVLMDPDGMCKLADFGAAVGLNAPSDGVVGTPPYVSPEACEGDVQSKSDIWSFGVTTCELITLQVPFLLDKKPLAHFRFLHAMINDKPKPAMPAQLLDVERSLILECLQRDLADRPTAKSLLQHAYFSSA